MEKTICLFGDSITWGAWDPERGGWGARLRSYFETNNIEVNVYNCGVSGNNTDDLLQRFKVEATARKPNIIIFAIGINDSQYVNSKDNPRVPIKNFKITYRN
jgi:lysophospholipase L1-like esterase